MSLRKILITSAIIILALLLLFMDTPPGSKRMPSDVNVILLTIDSLRPDHLQCYGYKKRTSPNIDAIAEHGQLFRRAYSQSVWTIPGIMSILTSLQPPVHQVQERGDVLDPQITTIFDCFRDAGYVVPNICFLLTIPEFSGIRIGPVEKEYFSEKDDNELFRWLDENHDSKFFLWYHHRGVHLPYRP
ncbi:MAG: sulfatase-like hydrolase/transferase, partial [Candidatus Abyssubacteria bacterium]|nr:sulfatase-like hydrolase/transferase [Candidatus Abyssubacteria bacterium]